MPEPIHKEDITILNECEPSKQNAWSKNWQRRNWENSSLLLVIVVIVLSIVTVLSTTDSATTKKQQGCSRPEHHYEAPGSKWHISRSLPLNSRRHVCFSGTDEILTETVHILDHETHLNKGLILILHNLFQKINENGIFSNLFYEANTTLLPKQTECKNVKL